MTTALEYLQGTRAGWVNATLAALTDNQRTDAINDAKSEVSSEAFGANYEIALALLAAENVINAVAVSAAGSSGQVGQVLEQQDGDVRVKYAQTTSTSSGGANDGEFLTVFGKKFARLRDQVAIGLYNSGMS